MICRFHLILRIVGLFVSEESSINRLNSPSTRWVLRQIKCTKFISGQVQWGSSWRYPARPSSQMGVPIPFPRCLWSQSVNLIVWCIVKCDLYFYVPAILSELQTYEIFYTAHWAHTEASALVCFAPTPKVRYGKEIFTLIWILVNFFLWQFCSYK